MTAADHPAPLVLVVGGDTVARRDLVAALAPWLGAATVVLDVERPGDAASVVHAATASGGPAATDPASHVALVVVLADDALGADPERDLGTDLATLAAADHEPAARVLIVTDRPRRLELSDAVDADRVDAIATSPAPEGALGAQARSLLRRWLLSADPAHPLLETLTADGAGPGSDLLRDLDLDDREVTLRLLEALDRALGPRPVLRLQPGTRLTHQDVDVNGLFVVRSGSVALDRETAIGHLRLHHETTGPVVGLLALAQGRRAYFTAVATTEVDVVHLTLEQLDLALRTEPEVGAVMATVAIRALAQRLRHSEHLQVERETLNRELEHERHELAQALRSLEAARFELVEQARLATLGELAAGVAHELNNPVAALGRAAAYVADDVAALLAAHPHAEATLEALRRSRDLTPRSTADERTARRDLTPVVGDALARRLVSAGLDEPELARRLAAEPADVLADAERAADLGGAIRNLEVAAARIRELAASLRSYARPAQAPLDGVDVHTTLDDALRLVAHRLQRIEVEQDLGSLPTIRAHPGPLSQVWTNLLVNAADALDGEGRVTVRTRQPDADHVTVEIIDDGPGIDPELLPRLLEPRFTTKEGIVRYGLGLGLPIAKSIVDGHRGRLEIDSEPGRTSVRVTLPLTGPGNGKRGGR